MPLEEDAFVRHLYWRMSDKYQPAHPHCKPGGIRRSDELVYPLQVVVEGPTGSNPYQPHPGMSPSSSTINIFVTQGKIDGPNSSSEGLGA